ncbi:hypothetical protein [Janthinobacterium sp. P210006]|uniref:hypothetical protein n=1 Tax=Janthinobacterium sp. P210006 TaxID=3112939 RepID=UPI002E268119|nr:hypothetical protein [Janthinobacterium sp. P210006]
MIVLALTVLTGCASADVYLRPERTVFAQKKNVQTALSLVENENFDVWCLDSSGDRAKPQSTERFQRDSDLQCLYRSVDKDTLLPYFKLTSTTIDGGNAALAYKRDVYIAYLMSVADQNCSNFLGRAFANKTSVDSLRGTLNDVLTGSTAAIATSAPPTAAALALTNLVTNKSIDNFNQSFYFEKTFSAMRSAIISLRSELRIQIQSNMSKNYRAYSISDAMSDMTRYDEGCSIMAGVNKLQQLADDSTKTRVELERVRASFVSLYSQRDDLLGQITRLNTKVSEVSASEDKAIAESLKVEISELRKKVGIVNASIDATAKSSMATLDKQVAEQKVEQTQVQEQAKVDATRSVLSGNAAAAPAQTVIVAPVVDNPPIVPPTVVVPPKPEPGKK